MSLGGRLISRAFRLPKPETRRIRIERDLRVPMPDGVELLADRWVPEGGDRLPVVLIRSPYGRRGVFGLANARPFAERGFQVLIQSCRGTFGSGGSFDPLHHERDDGLATIAWLREQPWYPSRGNGSGGGIGMFGPSYLGYVQWAVADSAGPELGALAPQVTAAELTSVVYGGGSFGLALALTWIRFVTVMEARFGTWKLLREAILPSDPLRKVWKQLPLSSLDHAATGRAVGFFQDWLSHAQANDPWWAPTNHAGRLADVETPVTMTAGWHDIFAPYQLRDFEKLRALGRKAWITIGPWQHTDPGVIAAGIHDALALYRAELKGEPGALREKPVRLFVQGAAREWREYESWPPEGTSPERWHLHAGARLAPEVPGDASPDEYRYDPTDPTPAIGGPALAHSRFAVDNRKLEARPDVLTWTSEVLADAVEIVGPVSAELWVDSDRVHTDFFVRVCDVHPDGASINVCDGLRRLRPGDPEPAADDTRRVAVELWPTAYRFARGHRIRVQVSSGAHPRFVRNPGSGEPLGNATTLLPARQRIHHGPARPSAVILPIHRRPGT